MQSGTHATNDRFCDTTLRVISRSKEVSNMYRINPTTFIFAVGTDFASKFYKLSTPRNRYASRRTSQTWNNLPQSFTRLLFEIFRCPVLWCICRGELRITRARW
jgi:hypothetical protein